MEMVNGNLKNCAHHKDTPLVLGLHCRIGFASNWRLSCKMCNKDSVSVKNSIDYLKRTLDSCDDRVEFRAVKKRIYKNNERCVEFRKRKKRRQASSPHVPLTHNKVLLMDYSANICAVIASFYVGTGGLDVGLINACQGISGGNNRSRHSLLIKKSFAKQF